MNKEKIEKIYHISHPCFVCKYYTSAHLNPFCSKCVAFSMFEPWKVEDCEKFLSDIKKVREIWDNE